MNNILLIILIITILFIYNNKTQEKIKYFKELSCKFTKHKTYNDSRYIILFYKNDFIGKEQIIFDNFNVNKKFINFYHTINNPFELILGVDKNIGKIYVTKSSNNNIYGLVNDNNIFKSRLYKSIFNLNKTVIDNFIGLNKSNLLYKIFNLKAPTVYEKYEDNIITSYHIRLDDYIIKYSINKIKKILDIFDCNTTNIDIWINKNINNTLRWLAITKKDNQYEITFYHALLDS